MKCGRKPRPVTLPAIFPRHGALSFGKGLARAASCWLSLPVRPEGARPGPGQPPPAANTCAGSQPPAAARGLTGQACAAVPAAGTQLPGRAGPRPSLGEAHTQAGTRGLGRSPGSRGEARITAPLQGLGPQAAASFIPPTPPPRKAGGGDQKAAFLAFGRPARSLKRVPPGPPPGERIQGPGVLGALLPPPSEPSPAPHLPALRLAPAPLVRAHPPGPGPHPALGASEGGRCLKEVFNGGMCH
ncbi:Triple Functional Domain Protein [Manis pentadactyla]|nr:Triple Functional Domain Protein [Manis pentadactyla]